MKLFLKILKLSSLLIIIIVIMLFSASFMLQDEVADIILRSLNKNIPTKIDIGSFKLSFLRKFPKASLQLRDVTVHSSKNFNSGAFTGINTDTLLAAKFVSVEFRISDIIRGKYNIERIGARDGKLNLLTDTSGNINYDISDKSKKAGDDNFSINLDKIYLTDISTVYKNMATRLTINGSVKNGKLKSRISGVDLDFFAEAELEINNFQLNNIIINQPITAGLDLTLQRSETGIIFRKGSLAVENYDFSLDGFISSGNILNLNISGNNIDIARVRNYLPERYYMFLSDYTTSGTMIIDCKINGLISRTSNPHTEISFSLNNGKISYKKSDITINTLSFSGYFSNGSNGNSESNILSISDINGKLGSSEFKGSIAVSGFENRKSELAFQGRVFPMQLKEFFDIKRISTAEGYVDADIKLVTDYRPSDSIKLTDIVDLKPVAELDFNFFSLGYPQKDFLINSVSGNLSLSDKILANNLRFNYKGQQIKIDGEFRNLPEWLAGREIQMIANADISFDRFIPEAFLRDPERSAIKNVRKAAFTLPDNISLDINFKIDTLTYKTFFSSKIEGTLNYRARLLTFKSLNMESLNGSISGNGFFVQNRNKTHIARGIFNLHDIDVNKAFKTFHNFGQNFIKDENLAGVLSGSLSILLPMDSLLKPQIKSLTAEGKYTLLNGYLINFDPVKQLSSFVRLSELENIHFERLENDFFIRNNFLYMPQMDVKSSAVDLSINGKHSFDNNYDYHVKMLLSEILSKKRVKNRNDVTEFGEVEDDGLGRTSLLLRIENRGKEVKVGYDIKAAGTELKKNLQSERQTLRSILNQEFGWYKKDSATMQKPEVKKSRFRISWDEADTIKSIPEPQAEGKESVVKSLFKKK